MGGFKYNYLGNNLLECFFNNLVIIQFYDEFWIRNIKNQDFDCFL